MAQARIEYDINMDEYHLVANGRRLMLKNLRPEISAMLNENPLSQAAKTAGVQQIEDTENVGSSE